MDKTRILRLVLLVVAIPVSFVMAFLCALPFESLGIPIPGMLASHVLVSPSSRSPHEFAGVGEMLRMQIVVDWLFWFALLCLGYFVFTKMSQKLKELRSNE